MHSRKILYQKLKMDHGGGRKLKYPDSNAIEITPEASSAGGRSNAPSLWATVDDEASRPREAHRILILTSSTSSTLVGEVSGRRPCKNFRSEEGCSRGGSCEFLHGEQSRSRENVAVSISPAVGSGRYGSGASGPNPRPSNWKTKLCTYWERGDCSLGSKCSYAHGTAELQHGGTRMQRDSRDSMQAGTSSRTRTDPIAASTTSVPHDKGVPTQETAVANQRQLCSFHPRQNDIAFVKKIYADWPCDIPPCNNWNPNPYK